MNNTRQLNDNIVIPKNIIKIEVDSNLIKWVTKYYIHTRECPQNPYVIKFYTVYEGRTWEIKPNRIKYEEEPTFTGLSTEVIETWAISLDVDYPVYNYSLTMGWTQYIMKK